MTGEARGSAGRVPGPCGIAATAFSRGALNNFQFIAYAISLAMCARSFGEYLATAAGGWQNAAAVIELALLISLVVVGFAVGGSSTALAPADGVAHVIAGAALMYTSFQGFAVITNAADKMVRPQRTVPWPQSSP